jgi:hypothetical protein
METVTYAPTVQQLELLYRRTNQVCWQKIIGRNSRNNRSNTDIRKTPEIWRTAIICPIHKKGNKLQCSNCRGITLINVCYKVLTNILHRRLIPYTEKILGDYHCGFRKRRSKTDNLIILRWILENVMNLIYICTHYARILILSRPITQ